MASTPMLVGTTLRQLVSRHSSRQITTPLHRVPISSLGDIREGFAVRRSSAGGPSQLSRCIHLDVRSDLRHLHPRRSHGWDLCVGGKSHGRQTSDCRKPVKRFHRNLPDDCRRSPSPTSPPATPSRSAPLLRRRA
jgi:hypothetical protein